MSKICNFCGNKNIIPRLVEYIYRRNNNFLIVNNVPCEECEYCGEQYFKVDVLKKIEKNFYSIYTDGKKTKKIIKVPVEDFVSL